MINKPKENYKTGYISVYRSLRKHWLWSKNTPLTNFEAWICILFEVNHKSEKVRLGYKIINCNRGESLNSLDTWSKLFNWNKSKVRRFLKLLENDSMIILKNEQKTTHLTVCNYDSYQISQNDNETKVKRKRNRSETEVTPNNNDNNDNNDNNEINIYRKFNHLKITFEENEKLIKSGYTQEQINSIYSKIENYKKNTKYKSLYLTSLDWLKREFGDKSHSLEKNNQLLLKEKHKDVIMCDSNPDGTIRAPVLKKFEGYD